MPKKGSSNYWWDRAKKMAVARQKSGHLIGRTTMRTLSSCQRKWERGTLKNWLTAHPERRANFENPSGVPLRRVYTPLDLDNEDYVRQIGLPGDFPFTRGVYPTMYRGRLWTMRMFSGYGTPEETNSRLKYLLKEGETGLSIAFDMPTLYGVDVDHPRAEGEVGKCGVSVSSLKDMEVLFDGIPLDEVSTSMTINAPASVLTCMYVAAAEKRGLVPSKLKGTAQTDILKEYAAQKEWVYPPEAHLRIIRDMMLYTTKHLPQWNYVSVSGYHIREAGSSALQELAFTLADGFAYVDLGIDAGLKVDDFAPRLSFFFNCGMDFFEEVAKFRAARRIWAQVLKERYKARKTRSMLLRFHTQTSGVSLSWQQPLNNIVRTAVEAMAAIMGGTQSLHTNSYDEAWALPTQQAALIALRTQQIMAEETGIADVVDPLGGSYYIEWLTDEMEERVYEYLARIEELGGILAAIKKGFIQREIADTSYKYQRQMEEETKLMVGVNSHVVNEASPIETLRIDESARNHQIQRLREVKKTRDAATVRTALSQLRNAFANPESNCIRPMLKAVKSYATLGEIVDVGRQVFGEWKEPSIL
ncbi:MAG TPA: methylmalonyl-CoA mutase family protein [Candidatus Acidoferrales bacterium]|nr:methylmalonyl-CoA mutase family protein [Candidatus Acidoferrales bacterium]